MSVDSGKCQNVTYHSATKSSKREEKCNKKAVWVIRKNGQEYLACQGHANTGVLVRKIAG